MTVKLPFNFKIYSFEFGISAIKSELSIHTKKSIYIILSLLNCHKAILKSFLNSLLHFLCF